uniref:Ankyrin repeat protein n=1 Tax=Micromonas pusilla TaxID=38833 RepID=A0A7S0I6W8_MICPS|mmetsp:Transcript_10187/g.41988  ORF Transcript_10187/g.41988 Transcript_10187/m.41988 type:complete len:263 (+) Transcript_10187:212-1000(+)
MDAKKRKREEYESDTVAYLRRGAITILDALDEQLPDVFAAEILPKLSLMDTLNLAQVSKAYRDSVWSVRGVQSLEAKIAAHLKKNKLRGIEQPICYATKYGNLPAIRALLQSGVDVDEPLPSWAPGCKGITALWYSCSRGHAAVVKELIEAGADVNVRATVKNRSTGDILSDVTPLLTAAQEGHTPVVIELIKAGADVNIPRSDGVTPLHMAARNGYEACVALLIQAGADVNATKAEWTPLSVAIHFKHEKVVKLLKHFGAR